MNYIKLLFKRLIGIDILQVFSLNAIATGVRMLAGMIGVKVVALLIGPSGIALLGQLSNFSTMLLGLANGGITSGIIKYISEFKKDEKKVSSYISNAFRITVICSLLIGVCLILLCTCLSRLILLTDEYYYVFIVFGFTVFFYALNGLIVSIINGYKEFKLYVRVNIIGTIAGTLYSIILVFLWGVPGALINTVTFQSVMIFVTLYLCRKQPWMNMSYFKQKLDKFVLKDYMGYALMSLLTFALQPVSQMFLRGYVISEISATDAGIWEGMNRISAMYLSVLTSAFTVYYIPRLSEITDPKELHDEVFRCYKMFIPILLLISVAIYLLKEFIIWLLFTPEFYTMESLFSWQLIGDFFKICSWLLAVLMIAKARTWMFISTEIIFSATYVILSFIFMRYNGVIGLTQGYLCNYMFYGLVMALLFRNVIRPQRNYE